jgi:hypothetical protein
MAGTVEAQGFTFAPSMPEFMREARRIQDVLPLRDQKRIAAPTAADRPMPYISESPQTKTRMSFKLSVLSAGIGHKQVERVKEANHKGLEYLIALGQEWGVPVPEALWTDPQNQRT